MSAPLFSVVVPAFQAEALLPLCLSALQQSDLPRAQWELVVVDDGSTDGTAEVAARFADKVLSLPRPNRGPGFARNEGAKVARGAWLVFLDADVEVHADTLRRIAERVAAEPDLGALFGTYDDAPAAKGLLTEYRNLSHRRVHLAGAGDAETFWAGCGAVRRDLFSKLGGFDVRRYPRPQIEDIELGYRLRAEGHRIALDPRVEAKHLKRWTLGSMLRTDIFDRGVPWMRLLLERKGQKSSLNTKGLEKVKVLLAALALGCIPLALANARFGAAALALSALLALSNLGAMRWFAQQRGVFFALGALPLHLLHYFSSAVAAALGVLLHLEGAPVESPAMPPPGDLLEQLLAPLHKRAMGAAVGLASALFTLAVTAVPLLRGIEDRLPLVLLAQFFYGYSPTWAGALVGAAWAGAFGFMAGFFFAACRNGLLALRLIQLRARAEYDKTRDLLDHI